MRISTKGRFAVTAMIDLALRETMGPVALTDIASRQHISLSYLEQLFGKLRRHGLVTSVRGPGGGYLMAGPVEGITVSDIIAAVEDAVPAAQRARASSVQDMTQELWDTMSAKVFDFTHSITLKRLVLDQLAKGVQIEPSSPVKRGVFPRPVRLSIHPRVPNSVFALGLAAREPG